MHRKPVYKCYRLAHSSNFALPSVQLHHVDARPDGQCTDTDTPSESMPRLEAGEDA